MPSESWPDLAEHLLQLIFAEQLVVILIELKS
jgi:hypothetical protein